MTRPEEMPARAIARRRLLHFLMQSPLLAAPGLLAPGLLMPARVLGRPEFAVPETLDQVLDVFQMQRAAQKVLDLETWHFIVNGADDLRTLDANRAAWNSLARSCPHPSCWHPSVPSRPFMRTVNGQRCRRRRSVAT